MDDRSRLFQIGEKWVLMNKLMCSFFPVLLGAALASRPVSGTAPASLRISAETAPAGGWAQIKIFAVKPMAIASGSLVVNLDPTAFGPGAMVGLFGANADAAGSAVVQGLQIGIQFSSATSGIGQIAGLPVVVVSVPLLASAAGRTVTISATSPDSSLSIASGSVTVKGTLSVQRIPAGMGVLPQGTVVPVYGQGFTPSTTVTVDGVEIASTRFLSANEIDATIGGATELAGKLARVADSGVEFDYFCFQPNDPVKNAALSDSRVANVQPLFPLFASTGLAGSSGYFGGAIAVENPNAVAATVAIEVVGNFSQSDESEETLSIPPGSWAMFSGGVRASSSITSNVPVRAVSISYSCVYEPAPACFQAALPFDTAAFWPPLALAPSSLAFTWQQGDSTVPAARIVSVSGHSTSASVTAAVSTSAGGAWLSATSATPGGFSVLVDPSQLGIGTYQGSVAVKQGYGPTATLPVSLTVTDAAVPMISASPAALNFTAPAFNAAPYSQSISLASSAPAAFSLTLQPGTWLKVSPMSGTTPATLTVTWDPAVTSQIYYQQRSSAASISVFGPGNAIAIPATFNVTGVQTFQTFLGESGTGPNGLLFSAQAGSQPQTQTIYVDPAGAISAEVDRPWMSAVAGSQTVSVTVDPVGLGDGVYPGTVTISEPGLASKAVPVTLGVWTTPPPLTITTSSFQFVEIVGEAMDSYQAAVVDSGGIPVPLTILLGASWLWVVDHYNAPTPAPIAVVVQNVPGPPGQYDGSFTIQSPGQSLYVPVTLLVEPGPVAPPVVSQVVNAASGTAGSLSPGEILTVRGYAAGAAAPTGLKLDASGMLAKNLNGLQVTFDGKPAPLLYTSANQTNLIVPYEIAGQTSTVLQVVYATAAGTLQTASWDLPVAPAAPGVFTLDATGTGQAAALNQDGSVNGAANPALRGSVVSIYATGEGQTRPAGQTGSVTQSATNAPVLPVTAKIGGLDARVQYAGSAPGEVAGLLQVNIVIPQRVSPGSAAPVTLTIGGIASQAGVTIAVNQSDAEPANRTDSVAPTPPPKPR